MNEDTTQTEAAAMHAEAEAPTTDATESPQAETDGAVTTDDLAELEAQWAQDEAAHDDRRDDWSDEERLNWFVGKVLAIKDEAKRLQLAHEARMRQLDGKLRGIEYRFGQDARNALTRLLDAVPGKKKPRSLILAAGKAGFRKTPESVVVESNEHVRSFAEAFPAAANAFAVEHVPVVRINKTALKAALPLWAEQHGGTFPPGISIKGGDDAFYIDVPK